MAPEPKIEFLVVLPMRMSSFPASPAPVCVGGRAHLRVHLRTEANGIRPLHSFSPRPLLPPGCQCREPRVQSQRPFSCHPTQEATISPR